MTPCSVVHVYVHIRLVHRVNPFFLCLPLSQNYTVFVKIIINIPVFLYLCFRKTPLESTEVAVKFHIPQRKKYSLVCQTNELNERMN